MLATRKTDGQKYAVKVLDSAETFSPLEIDVLVKADGCPYLIQFHGGFLRASPRGPEFGREVCMVLELMNLGSLSELKRRALVVNRIPSELLACITRQMVYGLNHLHKHRLIHRDIKLGNVLHNSRGDVKLTDFGLVLSQHKAVTAPWEGTRKYMAPDSHQSFASDVWSTGMVVCELALLRYPYDIGNAAVEVLIDVLPEPRLPESDETGEHPKALREFIELTLVKEVQIRATTESLLDHPFLWTPRSDPVDFESWLQKILRLGGDSERWTGFVRPVHRRAMPHR
jgi:serine/threonine protein kinase